MKEYEITTKSGQRALLKDMTETHALGYEKGEENLKNYNEGYIQALRDILGIDYQRFICNGNLYTNKGAFKNAKQ